MDIIDESIQVIKGFDPRKSTVDTHIYEFYKVHSEEELNDDQIFVREVLGGCVREKAALKVFLSTFYHLKGGSILRSDFTLYMVLGYIAAFRLEDIGVTKFKSLLAGIDSVKVHAFVDFIFNARTLNEWLRDQWIQVFDRSYVEDTLIKTLGSYKSAFKEFLIVESLPMSGRLSSRANATINSTISSQPQLPPSRNTKQATRAVAPNITMARLPQPKEPIKITQIATANEVPSTLNKTSLRKLESARQKRKDEIKKELEAKYNAPENKPFAFGETKTKARREAQLEKDLKETEIAEFKAKPAPDFSMKATAPVRLTVAAVLREDALLRKKQEEEAQILLEYEHHCRDSAEFDEWKKREDEKEEEARLIEVANRKVEMALAQQRAIEASENQKLENAEMAIKMKEETHEMLMEAFQEQQTQLKQQQDSAAALKADRELLPRQAEATIARRRREQSEKQRKEAEERRQEKMIKDAQEAAERADLIRQIRALERVPKKRQNVFDPSTTAGQGILDEMSLVELHERLRKNKDRMKAQEEIKRKKIIQEKSEQEDTLNTRMHTIQKNREAAKRARDLQRQQKKEIEKRKAEAQKKARENAVVGLAEKLQAKREKAKEHERKVKEEHERIAKQRMFLGAAKRQIEEKHFDQQLIGAEREAKQRMTTHKTAKQRKDAIRSGEVSQRHTNLRKTINAKNKINEDAKVSLREKALSRKLLEQTLSEGRRSRFETQRTHASSQKQQRDQKNAYAAAQSKRTIESGKMWKQTQTLKPTGSKPGLARRLSKSLVQAAENVLI